MPLVFEGVAAFTGFLIFFAIQVINSTANLTILTIIYFIFSAKHYFISLKDNQISDFRRKILLLF